MDYYKRDEKGRRIKPSECPNNDGVMCTMKNCACCGWNPTVEKMRLDNIFKKMRKKHG